MICMIKGYNARQEKNTAKSTTISKLLAIKRVRTENKNDLTKQVDRIVNHHTQAPFLIVILALGAIRLQPGGIGTLGYGRTLTGVGAVGVGTLVGVITVVGVVIPVGIRSALVRIKSV
jgi:hypothetical protein